jgi:hypothetical protein
VDLIGRIFVPGLLQEGRECLILGCYSGETGLIPCQSADCQKSTYDVLNVENKDILVVHACLGNLLCEILGDMIGCELIPGNLLDGANGGKVSQEPACVLQWFCISKASKQVGSTKVPFAATCDETVLKLPNNNASAPVFSDNSSTDAGAPSDSAKIRNSFRSSPILTTAAWRFCVQSISLLLNLEDTL